MHISIGDCGRRKIFPSFFFSKANNKKSIQNVFFTKRLSFIALSQASLKSRYSISETLFHPSYQLHSSIYPACLVVLDISQCRISEPISLWKTFYLDRPKISAVAFNSVRFFNWFSLLNFWYIHATGNVDLHIRKLGFLDLMSPEWHEVSSYFHTVNSHSLR